MGLNRKKGAIDGLVRTTYYSPETSEKMMGMGLAPVTDNSDDIYRNNIQIAELNTLNACLAVLKYKQLMGFYHQESSIYHELFEIGDLKTYAETWPA